ncbi:acyltransferase [Sphingobium sp.]|uniref:acyltransferase family protein n=1 Tax=Sphingobium sp. TaxID=1912891 RepID=UPI002ED3805B
MPVLVAASNSQRLPHLDGLRGMAAMAVLFYHVQNLFRLTFGFERGYLFVDVFFMLSGFVLSLAWAGSAGHSSAVLLLKARLHRLWPTIAAASILGAVIHAILGDSHVPLNLLLALFLVPVIWREGSIYPINGVQWSLFWEVLANVAHVFLLRRISTNGLFALGVLMGLLFAAAIQWYGDATFGPDADYWWLALVRVGWSYTVGALMARLYNETDWKPVVSWWQALALFMLSVLALPLLPFSWAVGDTLLVIVVLPTLFWLLVTAKQPIRCSRWLAQLGALSFPLYATHLPLLTLFSTLDLPRSLSAVLATIIALVLSAWFGRRQLRRAPTNFTPPANPALATPSTSPIS